jgi:hypothetical protein
MRAHHGSGVRYSISWAAGFGIASYGLRSRIPALEPSYPKDSIDTRRNPGTVD